MFSVVDVNAETSLYSTLQPTACFQLSKNFVFIRRKCRVREVAVAMQPSLPNLIPFHNLGFFSLLSWEMDDVRILQSSAKLWS